MNPVYSKSKITVSVGLHTQRKGGMMLSSDIELSNSQILADQLRYVYFYLRVIGQTGNLGCDARETALHRGSPT